MVSCWKLVQALSTKARASPGLHRIPHSLETSLFYAHRFLIVHLIHSASTKRQLLSRNYSARVPLVATNSTPSHHNSSSHLPLNEEPMDGDTGNSTSTSSFSQQQQLEEQHACYCALRDILIILFHIPHMEQMMKQHFSETENILRLVASSYFSHVSEADALPWVHQLAGTVLESHKDQLTTANLVLIATLLHRDDQHWSSGAIKRKESIMKMESRKSMRIQNEVDASPREQESESRHLTSTGSLHQEGNTMGHEPAQNSKTKGMRKGDSNSIHSYEESEDDRASTIAREQWREKLLNEALDLCSARLVQNIENGFPDDNLTSLCQKHTETRGFHILQGESLHQSMTYAEFTFFFTLLTDRIKRKQLLSSASSSSNNEEANQNLDLEVDGDGVTDSSILGNGGGMSGALLHQESKKNGSQDTQVERIPGIRASLVKRVSLALEQLCLFHHLEAIATHRPIHSDELKFILEVALSPVASWSQHGLVAFRRFVAAHRAHPERGAHPSDILSTMPEEDQCYLRATCLRRLSNAPLAQLAECFMHMLPLFMYPVVVDADHRQMAANGNNSILLMSAKHPSAGNSTAKQVVCWKPSPGLRFMSTMQKKRFFSVARSSLYLFRMRPTDIHVVQKMYEKSTRVQHTDFTGNCNKNNNNNEEAPQEGAEKKENVEEVSMEASRDSPAAIQRFFSSGSGGGSRTTNDDEVLMDAITSLAEHFVVHAHEEHPFPVKAHPPPPMFPQSGGITVLVEPSSPPSCRPTAALSSPPPPVQEKRKPSRESSASRQPTTRTAVMGLAAEKEADEGRKKRLKTHKTMLIQERVRAFFSACEHCLQRHKSSPWLVGSGSQTNDPCVEPAPPPFTTVTEQSYFDGFVRYLLPEADRKQLEVKISSWNGEADQQQHCFVEIPDLLCVEAVYGLMDLLPSVFTFLRSLLHRPGANGAKVNLALASIQPDGKSSWDCFHGRLQPTPHLGQQLEVALLRTIQHIVVESFNSQSSVDPSLSSTLRADHLQQVLRYMVQTLTLNYMFWQARSHHRKAEASSAGISTPATGGVDLPLEATSTISGSPAGFLSDSMVPFIPSEATGDGNVEEHGSSAPAKDGLMSIPLAAAELAAACLNLYVRERDRDAAATTSLTTSSAGAVNGLMTVKSSPSVLVSMAILSVVLLDGLVLPSSHQFLKDKASDKALLLRLFDEFGVVTFSIPHVFELLALVFTHREKPRDEHENETGCSSMSQKSPVIEKGSRQPSSSVRSRASLPSASEEDGCLAAIDLEDTVLLEAGLRAARRVAHHHRCYEPLTLQERIRVVEHCTRIYLSIQHRFYVLDLAQKAGITCLSACAYISLEHQFASIMEGGRGGDYEKRRMQYLSQSLWHFYTMAMARPVHSGPQVEKYLRIILRFLRHHVAMVPHRKGTSTEDSFDLCLIKGTRNGKRWWGPMGSSGYHHHTMPQQSRRGGTSLRGRAGQHGMNDYNHYVEGGTEGEAALVQVRWKNIEQVQKINEVFNEFIVKLSLQSSSRFAERTGIQPFSNSSHGTAPSNGKKESLHHHEQQQLPENTHGAGGSNIHESGTTRVSHMDGKKFFLLNDIEASLLSHLTPHEKAILYRNVALRRAIRQPIHAFQVAITNTQKDNLPIRRAVTLSELYVILVHKHAHELLPALWKEVCSQMMFFRQMYVRADSPGVCVLDTQKGKEVQQMMAQLSAQYLQFETTQHMPAAATAAANMAYQPAPPGPPVSYSGIFMDISTLSFLYASTMASVKDDAFLLGNGGYTRASSERASHNHGDGGAKATGKKAEASVTKNYPGLLNPNDLEHLSAVLEKEIEVGASTAWKHLTERQYASSVNMLHRGLRDILS